MSGLEFHFFPRRGFSLPIFMNGGELKFLGGIEKYFRYFTIFNFITSINKNMHLAINNNNNNNKVTSSYFTLTLKIS